MSPAGKRGRNYVAITHSDLGYGAYTASYCSDDGDLFLKEILRKQGASVLAELRDVSDDSLKFFAGFREHFYNPLELIAKMMNSGRILDVQGLLSRFLEE